MRRLLPVILISLYSISCAFGQWRNIGIGDISVIELAGGGNTWFGSNGNGAELYFESTQTYDTFSTQNTPQLRSDSITAILYTQTNGSENVFVGTKKGLACYNGTSWDTISHVSGRAITGLILTAGDSLWVLTADSGIFIFDSTGHTYLGCYNTSNSAIPANLISSGQTGSSSCGSYCIATANNGCFYTTDGITYTVIDTSQAGKGLVDNRVSAVRQKNDCSATLIGTQGGYSSCPPGLACTNFTTANGLPQNEITALGEDCSGQIWVGTRDSGIAVYNPRLNAISQFANVIDTIDRGTNWLVQGKNGLMYGSNIFSGYHDAGMLVTYDPAQGTESILYTFDTTWGSGHLWNPIGKMIVTDTTLFGLTASGGNSFDGTAFQYFLNGNDIIQRTGFFDTIGEFPQGIILASNNLAYGVTYAGGHGTDTFGVLFRYDINTFKRYDEYSFDSIVNGAHPDGNLMQAANGLIYGSTPVGGAYNKGTLFQFDPVAQAYSKLYDFKGGADGDHPSGPVIRGSDGLLYGTTQFGGTGNGGMLFAFDSISGTAINLHQFTAPVDSPTYLYLAKNGIFYGLTQGGSGSLFEYNPYNNNFSTIQQFNASDSAGAAPFPSIAETPQGTLIIRTTTGGAAGYGRLNQFNPQYAKVKTYTTANGLSSNQITTLALDPSNCETLGYIGTADGNISSVDTTGTVKIVNVTPNGLQHVSAAGTGVYLYPQPASSQLQFVFSRSIEQGTLTVIDLYGQQLKQYELNNQNLLTADILRLAPGMYFFSLEEGGRIFSTGKISVAR